MLIFPLRVGTFRETPLRFGALRCREVHRRDFDCAGGVAVCLVGVGGSRCEATKRLGVVRLARCARSRRCRRGLLQPPVVDVAGERQRRSRGGDAPEVSRHSALWLSRLSSGLWFGGM